MASLSPATQEVRLWWWRARDDDDDADGVGVVAVEGAREGATVPNRD
jgi:hypothetical protein